MMNQEKGTQWAVQQMTDKIDSMTNTRAKATSRTEMAKANSQARLEQAKLDGKEYFIVISQGDACEDCYAVYDGNVFNINDDLDMLPPKHVNCDCEAIFFKTEEQARAMADEVSKPRDEGQTGEG